MSSRIGGARAVAFCLALTAGIIVAPLSARSEDAAVSWLKQHSMLLQGEDLADQIEGTGTQWHTPYALARPDDFLEKASAWFAAYPAAIVGPPGASVLDTLGNPALLAALSDVGIDAIHTGPMKRAGSVRNGVYGPSIDGYFDRIELAIAPAFGDLDAYHAMVRNAGKVGVTIIGDLVPGHTGKGPDFRLAERDVPGFPGIYTMVEIAEEDWPLLPDVPAGEDSVNISQETAAALRDKGYIVGPLEFVVFARPGIKESSWSATDVVSGVDGVRRRWVYLHFFKRGQPSLNWLDPSFGAQRLVGGDILHSLRTLGVTGLRLDANMFLGIGPRAGGQKGWVGGHPLSGHATNTIAMLIRKFGGYSFQELNTSLDKIHQVLDQGPELAYDFTTRPAWIYAVATGDAGPLRLLLRLMLEFDVPPGRMVHGLQNHDELMMEATHLTLNGAETFTYESTSAAGQELFERIPEETLAVTTGPARPYNARFAMSPGLCSTVTGLAAAAIGVERLDAITDEQKERIKRMHLAAASFNALMPGAFVLTGWDLTGALPVPREAVADRLSDNDCRWLNRGAYDLLDFDPSAETSTAGLPRARTLYGSLPEQLKEPDSFASRLKEMLAARKALGLSRGRVIAVPEVANNSLVVMVHALPDGHGGTASHAVTAVNFSDAAIKDTIALPDGLAVAEARTAFSTARPAVDETLAVRSNSLPLSLQPYEGLLVLIKDQ